MKEAFLQVSNLLKSNDPQLFFYLGIILSASLWLLLRCFFILRGRKQTQGFYVPGENGDLLIQQGAISDFVIRVLAGRVKVVVNKVNMYPVKGEYVLSLMISLPAGIYVEETISQVHDLIFNEVSTRLGIQNLKQVHIVVKDFSTQEKDLAKQGRKALPEEAVSAD